MAGSRIPRLRDYYYNAARKPLFAIFLLHTKSIGFGLTFPAYNYSCSERQYKIGVNSETQGTTAANKVYTIK